MRFEGMNFVFSAVMKMILNSFAAFILLSPLGDKIHISQGHVISSFYIFEKMQIVDQRGNSTLAYIL